MFIMNCEVFNFFVINVIWFLGIIEDVNYNVVNSKWYIL